MVTPLSILSATQGRIYVAPKVEDDDAKLPERTPAPAFIGLARLFTCLFPLPAIASWRQPQT